MEKADGVGKGEKKEEAAKKQTLDIKQTDMDTGLFLLTTCLGLKDYVISVSKDALEKCSMERDIAAFIKRELDKEKGLTWHCIVGSKFGLSVTHEASSFIYFTLDNVSILLFKAG